MDVYAKAQQIDDDDLDAYAQRGVVLSRDSAHRVLAALHRDAYEMRKRGGAANERGAEENEGIANAIGQALTTVRPAEARRLARGVHEHALRTAGDRNDLAGH